MDVAVMQLSRVTCCGDAFRGSEAFLILSDDSATRTPILLLLPSRRRMRNAGISFATNRYQWRVTGLAQACRHVYARLDLR